MLHNVSQCITFPTSLNVNQQRAIQLLAQGKSDAEVARIIGVHRITVGRWKLSHPTFQARLNAARLALWNSISDNLRSILPSALDILTKRLRDSENPPAQFRAAVQALKIAGVSKAVHRIGPIYVKDVLQDRFYTESHRFNTIDPECRMYQPHDDQLAQINSGLIEFITREESADAQQEDSHD